MTVTEIVEAWLREHGYDGLYKDPDYDCACFIGELFLCGELWGYACHPGYRVPGHEAGCPFDIVEEARREHD